MAATCSSGSGPSCGSTSSPATTRSGPSAGTSAAGSTRSAKRENNYFGFGTDNDVEHAAGYPIIKHLTFAGPAPPTMPHARMRSSRPAPRCWAATRGRPARLPPELGGQHLRHELRLAVGHGVEALNQGAALAGCLQNTGEGGLSPHHRHGGDIVFQIGTSYFGCRDERGRFDLTRLMDLVAVRARSRAIEVKLSQGAKPGLGGLLPGEKVTARSPRSAASRWARTARRRAGTRSSTTSTRCSTSSSSSPRPPGCPVGIKSAVGNLTMWDELTDEMSRGDRGVDFVNIDGGEGGTGAAPMIFADSVAYPFRIAFAEVYRRFAAAGPDRRRGLHRRRQAGHPRERRRRLRAGRATWSTPGARR